MARATTPAPTAEDKLFSKQIELWATGQELDESIIPKCFTKDNLRQRTSNLGSNLTLYRFRQEYCSCRVSWYVPKINGDFSCYFDRTDPPASAKMQRAIPPTLSLYDFA